MINRGRKILNLLLCSLIVAICSCHRHKYHYPEYMMGKIMIDFDWAEYQEIPPGMNLRFYQIDSDGSYTGVVIPYQMQSDGGELWLYTGKYHAIIYNDYTYNLRYRDLDTFHEATTYLTDYDRMPLASRITPGSRNLEEPDIFYTTHLLNLEISPTDTIRVIKVYPKLKTLDVRIHVKVDGIENLSMSDGVISGFASSINLSTGESEDVTPNNRIFPFTFIDDWMYAETKVFLMSNPLERTYTLEIAFLLRNNSVLLGKHLYDITDQFVKSLEAYKGDIPEKGIDIYITDIIIDDVAESGGLEATIDGWGGSETIILE